MTTRDLDIARDALRWVATHDPRAVDRGRLQTACMRAAQGREDWQEPLTAAVEKRARQEDDGDAG